MANTPRIDDLEQLATDTTAGQLNRSTKGTTIPLTTTIGTNLDSAPTVNAYYERINDMVWLQLFVTADATATSSWIAHIDRADLTALGINGDFINMGMGMGYRSSSPSITGVIYTNNNTQLTLRALNNNSSISQLWVFNIWYRSTV